MRLSSSASKLTLTLAFLAAAPVSAAGGWHARQVSRGEAAGPEANAKSDLYYQDGQLRIDQGATSSVILRMRSGRLVILDHAKKSYIDDSITERIEQRNKMIEALKARRSELPPEAQKRFDEEFARFEKGQQTPAPRPTGKKDKVGKWSCEVHGLSDDNMQSEICLAKDVGVKLDEFAKDAKTFGALMDKLGAKAPGASLLLDITERGFPVRMKQKVRASKDGPWIEGSSEMELFEAMNVPAEKFQVPTTYTRHAMPEMPPPSKAPPRQKP